MRDLLKHIAWAFATAAMILATPMQAAATSATNSNGTGTAASLVEPATNANSVTKTTLLDEEAGRGWAELYCMTCVGVGSFVLYSGGISMLPLLLGHTGTISTLTGSCVLACESAIKSLLK